MLEASKKKVVDIKKEIAIRASKDEAKKLLPRPLDKDTDAYLREWKN
jgi:hypothetical protein